MPGTEERVLATALISRIAPRKEDPTEDTGLLSGSIMHEAASVEVYDACFVEGVLPEDYEASDLLYESDAYGEYETDHFGAMGVPRTLGALDDLRRSSTLSVRFLWYAAFVTVNT